MSNISVNTITDALGGSTASINGLTPQASNMQPFNRIINGAMTVDQRNAGAAVTATTSYPYTLDRWQCGGSQNSKFTVQQSSVAPDGHSKSVVLTSSSAYTVGAGENFLFFQNIEGSNVADLKWGTASAKAVTVSFWVRSSLTGTFGGSIQNSATDRSYPYTYTISSANTWEYKTVSLNGDTGGTWLTTNGVGIIVRFSLGVGATFSGTAGSWAGTNYLSATGATSVVGTSGATFYITGVQLEAGSTASSFAHENVGDTLQKCQRYFQKLNGSLGTYSASGEAAANYYRHLTETRAAPSVAITTNPTYVNSSSLTNDENTPTGSRFYVLVTSTGRAFATGFIYTADAEL